MQYLLFSGGGVLFGALVVFLVFWRNMKTIESLYETERQKSERLEENVRELTAQNATLHAQNSSAKEGLAAMKEEFRLLAYETMEKTTEKNRENIDLTLKPLKEQLEGFRKKVDDTYNAESSERKHLSSVITELKAQNQKLGDEAKNLTEALKNKHKTQGIWGEMVLENILTASGLRSGFEYDIQSSHIGDDGERIIPDAIVHMPDGKNIIIDSKVTLNSYLSYCEAQTPHEKTDALKLLLASIKKHIDGLSGKRYQDIDNAFEYVFMFIPLEGAYMCALTEDTSLFEYALKKNIALVTASSLMTTLKTVFMIWRSERQNTNAAAIAKEAGAVYDKIAGFMSEFEKIHTNLRRASDSYESARKLLATGRGAALARLEKIKDMGAKTQKSIEEYIEYADIEQLHAEE